MSKLLFGFALTLLACAPKGLAPARGEPARGLDWLWLHFDSEWQKSPRELEYTEYTARVRLLRLGSDDELSLLSCLVRRSDEAGAISPGDGYVIYRGRMTREGKKLIARYVKAEEMIPSSDPPFARFLETEVMVRDEALEFGGLTYTRSELVTLADYDQFVKRIPSAVPAK